MKFTISCKDTNPRHTTFAVYDFRGANCGTLTILTDDIPDFIQRSWNGNIQWNGRFPRSVEHQPVEGKDG